MVLTNLDSITEEEIKRRLCNWFEDRLPGRELDLYFLLSKKISPSEFSRVRSPNEAPVLAFVNGMLELGYSPKTFDSHQYRNAGNTRRFTLGELKWLQDAIDDAVCVTSRGNPSLLTRDEFFRIKDSIFSDSDVLKKRFELYFLAHEVAVGAELNYDFEAVISRERRENKIRSLESESSQVGNYQEAKIAA